jgi:hypothetical protein
VSGQRGGGRPPEGSVQRTFTLVLPSVDAWQRWRASLPALEPVAQPGFERLALYDMQGERCAICLALYCSGPQNRRVDPAPWLLELDHDHATDMIRGLLCASCNSCEAHPRYALHPLFCAYRAAPPAIGMGWQFSEASRGSWARPARREYARRTSRQREVL